MSSRANYICELVIRGGPTESEYTVLDRFISEVFADVERRTINAAGLATIREAFGESFSTTTMQGFAFQKPHGYPGDCEIIDRIYSTYISADPRFSNMDRYWQTRPAAKAVRNRKIYFHTLLDRVYAGEPLRILKIASGPGRSMFEWLAQRSHAKVHFDCVEMDPKAIRYASELNARFIQHITFFQVNALRFRPTEMYPLIWAAGIFDYFNDDIFVRMVRRLLPPVSPGGGNW